MLVHIPFQILVRISPKGRERERKKKKKVIPVQHLGIIFPIKRVYDHVKTDTSSPASSYKHSSRVACIWLTIIVKDNHKENEKQRENKVWNAEDHAYL